MTIKKSLLVIFCLIISTSSFALKLRSEAFRPYHRIPVEYTCNGKGISPPLRWTNVPAGTRSYVLILQGPDAANGTWDHWVLYNIPVKVSSLDKNPEALPEGVKVGQNSWGKNAYGGPCPPKGKHRYVFTLYALNESLNLPEGSTKKQVLAAIKPDMAVGKAKLVGVFKH